MPTTREVEAARVERMRRAAEQRATQAPRPASASGRRTARAEAAHARAQGLKGPRWLCHVDGCAIRLVPQPAPTVALAERAAMAHYDREHYIEVPPWADDWQAAGRPRLDGWLDGWLAAHAR